MDGHSHLTPPYPSTSEDHHHLPPSDAASPPHAGSSQDGLDDVSSESSVEQESADEDYQADIAAPSEDDLEQADRSASEDSQRSGKRKRAAPDSEDYIKNDPELYGLRRSVRYPSSSCLCFGLTSPLRDVLGHLTES